MPRETFTSIDEYIDSCDPAVQPTLQQLRGFIKELAPNAAERIAWAMPTFHQKTNIVHFCAHKKHIGLYPGSEGIAAFTDEFDKLGLKYSKGAVQLPLDKPLPYDLIKRIVQFRLDQTAD